jgi:hypothetical protein
MKKKTNKEVKEQRFSTTVTPSLKIAGNSKSLRRLMFLKDFLGIV